MPRQTRHSTEFSGVYFVELANENKSFFIRYKRNGKSVEEKAGRSNEGWNAEKAWHLRTERMSEIEFNSPVIKDRSDLNEIQLWTFSKIFEKYLRLRPELRGRENDIYRFKNYLEMDFADITPEALTCGDVERFRHNLENKGLKPATVRHVLELLRRIANFAVKKNYCSGLSFKIEMPKVENQKTENLSHDQLDKLLQVLDEEQDLQVSNLVRLALYTGMRRGELFELCWSDIDFYDKMITVRSGKKGQYPKIPLNEMAEKILAEHAHVGCSSKFVFPGGSGKKRTECKRSLLRIRKKAGLPDDFRLLQGLRHVYASMLVSRGNVDLKTLQSLLTQKSPLMTNRYAHLLDHGEDFSKSEIPSHNKTDLDYMDSELNIEVREVELHTDSTDAESKEEFSETVLSTKNTEMDESAEVANDAITMDYVEMAKNTDYTDLDSNEEFPEVVIATHSKSNEGVPEVEITKDTTDIEIKSNYTDSDSKEEVPETVLSSENAYLEENVEVDDDSITSENMEIKLTTNSTASDSYAGLLETELDTKIKEINEINEVSNNVIISDYLETGIDSDSKVSDSNDLVLETVLTPEKKNSEIQEDFLEKDETPEVLIADDYKENTERELFTDNTDNKDMEITEEVQETIFDEDNTGTLKQQLFATEPESKSPELSHLVKQNYSANKPADSLVREEYSQNNNVSEKKVEARIQKKVSPTLKDLKNDLKSLSQLIHEAPRKSKSTTPKRKQS